MPLAVAAVIASVGTAGEQRPAESLPVLAKDATAAEIEKAMRGYNQDLGVGCNYCHAEHADGRPDYVSDDVAKKQTARVMIGLLHDINTRYLAQLGDLRYIEPVTCGTCHRGQSTPPSFIPAVKGRQSP